MRLIDAIACAYLLAGLIALVVVLAVWHRRMRPRLCDHCENLRAKVGREYSCTRNPGSAYTKFVRLPSYCCNFSPRKENTDG